MSDLYKRQNLHKLYRDKESAMIAGVCAGIADYFGFNRKGTRVVTAFIVSVSTIHSFRNCFLHLPGDCITGETD